MICMSVLSSACAPNEAGQTNKTAIGTVGGAAAGALLGSTIGKGSGKILGIAAGAVLGGIAGNAIGASLDRNDLIYKNQAEMMALENNKVGVSSAWRNPDSGNSGYIVPTRTYIAEGGRNCREYTQTIKVGGKTQEGFGKACRRNDGSWEIVQ